MKKSTMNYILEGARFTLAMGCGTFVRGCCKTITACKSKPAKVGYWCAGIATAWALGYACDRYIDGKAKVLLGILKPDGTWTDEFVDEVMNNE